MAKLVRLSDEIVAFKCPGCRGPQQLPIKGPKAWQWNNSMDKPTFKPSVLAWWGGPDPKSPVNKHGVPWNERKHVCHSFVTDGKIQFLGDCTHKLAGQTVELPEVSEESDLFYKPGASDELGET